MISCTFGVRGRPTPVELEVLPQTVLERSSKPADMPASSINPRHDRRDSSSAVGFPTSESFWKSGALS